MTEPITLYNSRVTLAQLLREPRWRRIGLASMLPDLAKLALRGLLASDFSQARSNGELFYLDVALAYCLRGEAVPPKSLRQQSWRPDFVRRLSERLFRPETDALPSVSADRLAVGLWWHANPSDGFDARLEVLAAERDNRAAGEVRAELMIMRLAMTTKSVMDTLDWGPMIVTLAWLAIATEALLLNSEELLRLRTSQRAMGCFLELQRRVAASDPELHRRMRLPPCVTGAADEVHKAVHEYVTISAGEAAGIVRAGELLKRRLQLEGVPDAQQLAFLSTLNAYHRATAMLRQSRVAPPTSDPSMPA